MTDHPTTDDLVHMGRDYAWVVVAGKNGNNVVHITPLGHQWLGDRLRGIIPYTGPNP